MKSLLVFAALLATVVALLAAPSTQHANADIPDEEPTPPKINRNWEPDRFGYVRPSNDGTPAIARNLVTLKESDPIKVCSEPHYETATRQAIANWNAGVGTEVLEYQGFETTTKMSAPSPIPGENEVTAYVTTSNNCPLTSERTEVASIVIRSQASLMDCSGVPLGCTKPSGVSPESFTYTGRSEVRINEMKFDNLDSDAVDTGDENRTGLIMHEIGHALGFSHPYQATFHISGCPPDVIDLSVPGTMKVPGITEAHVNSIMLPTEDCFSDEITEHDRGVYEEVLTPNAPKNLTANDVGQSVRVTWDVEHIRVEKEFVVQYRLVDDNGDWQADSTWTTVGTVDADQGEHVVDRPSAKGRYRVVAVTDAFGADAVDDSRNGVSEASPTYAPPPPPPPPPIFVTVYRWSASCINGQTHSMGDYATYNAAAAAAVNWVIANCGGPTLGVFNVQAVVVPL